MRRKLLKLAVVWTLTVSAVGSKALPLYSLTHLDYVSSEPLTSAAVYPAQYDAIEVPGGAPGVAWVRSSGTRTLRIALTNPTIVPHSAPLVLSDFRYASASGDFVLTVTPPSRTLDFPALGQSNIVEFTIQGLPNFVTLGDLTYDLACASPYAVLGGDLGTRVWLTDSAPIGSSHGHQVPVWANVLEDACLWATGRTGPVDCRWWCTFKMYHSVVFVYDPSSPRYVEWDQEEDSLDRFFKLKRFFLDRGSSPFDWVNGDCQDVSTYLQIALSSIGVSIETRQVVSNWQFGFLTNHHCPIGSDSTNILNYQPYVFTMHQPCFVSASGPVYDAALGQWRDLSGSAYQNPPMNWAWPGYWQVDHRPSLDEFGSGFKGLTRSRAVPPLPSEGEPVPVYDPPVVILSGLL